MRLMGDVMTPGLPVMRKDEDYYNDGRGLGGHPGLSWYRKCIRMNLISNLDKVMALHPMHDEYVDRSKVDSGRGLSPNHSINADDFPMTGSP